ncbi:MAG: hypothetical protein NTV51_10290 [Verrucomicrobia bacterium]|nr:hypothetical protein [Verrucomicrobiota bacterium]
MALINADLWFLDRNDLTMTPGEKLNLYTEAWNEILSGKSRVADVADLQEVLEREGQLGFRPAEQYARPPFTAISRLMEKEGLTTTDVQVFLRWKAKNENTEKARAAKAKKNPTDKMEKHRAKVVKFFGKDRFNSTPKSSF